MTSPADPPLEPQLQRRGRRLAVLSHPFSMTFRLAIVGGLATQALVTLGASAAAVGAQAGLVSFAALIQLPALRLLETTRKRSLLIATQVLALVAALPLVFFAYLSSLEGLAVPAALVCLAGATLALTAGSAAWWPLLHGYVARSATGRFFAVLRSLWHVALIAFFLGSAWWLDHHPGDFGPLFGVAWVCGAIRVGLVVFFPERVERNVLSLREVAHKARKVAPFRSYLAGVTLNQIVFRALPPFTILLLRREAGLSEGETLWLTVATFTGGLLALFPAGRVADKVGVRPVLLATCLLRALLVLGLAGAALSFSGRPLLYAACGLFLTWAFLTSAFGVAEVKLLFSLAGESSPSGVIVISVVIRSVIAGLVALCVGFALDALITAGIAAIPVYVGFFVLAAGVQGCAALPFRRVAA
jgi:hypothetical protein